MASQVAECERVLVGAVRSLPPERAAQLVDFARFLEAQALAADLAQGEDAAAVEASEARWDELLATEEAQSVLDALADEALAEDRAGCARPVTVDDEGRIGPG